MENNEENTPIQYEGNEDLFAMSNVNSLTKPIVFGVFSITIINFTVGIELLLSTYWIYAIIASFFGMAVCSWLCESVGFDQLRVIDQFNKQIKRVRTLFSSYEKNPLVMLPSVIALIDNAKRIIASGVSPVILVQSSAIALSSVKSDSTLGIVHTLSYWFTSDLDKAITKAIRCYIVLYASFISIILSSFALICSTENLYVIISSVFSVFWSCYHSFFFADVCKELRMARRFINDPNTYRNEIEDYIVENYDNINN